MRLYEISNAIVESQHDEVDIEQLKQLEMAFKDKAVACAAVTKNLRAESDAVDAEIQRLMKWKAAIDNNRKRLIDSTTGYGNPISIHLAEKLGYVRDGVCEVLSVPRRAS